MDSDVIRFLLTYFSVHSFNKLVSLAELITLFERRFYVTPYVGSFLGITEFYTTVSHRARQFPASRFVGRNTEVKNPEPEFF